MVTKFAIGLLIKSYIEIYCVSGFLSLFNARKYFVGLKNAWSIIKSLKEEKYPLRVACVSQMVSCGFFFWQKKRTFFPRFFVEKYFSPVQHWSTLDLINALPPLLGEIFFVWDAKENGKVFYFQLQDTLLRDKSRDEHSE